MSIKNIINSVGTTGSTLSLAARGGNLPRGIHFALDGEGAAGVADAGTDDKTDDDDDAEDGAEDDAEASVPKRQFDGVFAELRKTRDELKALKANAPSADEINELREFKAEKAKLEQEQKKKKGDYEKLLSEQQTKHAKELAEWQDKFNTERAARQHDRLDAIFGRVVPSHTDVPVDDLAPLLRPYFKFDDDGDLTIDANGTWPLNDQGKEMTPEEFIAKFIADRPHFARFVPKGGSGGGNGRGKGNGGKGKFTDEQIRNMSQAEFEKHHDEIMAQIGQG